MEKLPPESKSSYQDRRFKTLLKKDLEIYTLSTDYHFATATGLQRTDDGYFKQQSPLGFQSETFLWSDWSKQPQRKLTSLVTSIVRKSGAPQD